MILGTKTSIKLLNVIFSEPLHEFKEIELIRKAKTGKGSASNIIKDMAKENVLLEKRIGKTNVLSLNLKNHYVFLLKNLFDGDKMLNMSDTRRAAIALFKDGIRENAQLVVIFGSCITTKATEKSDIDILVVSDNFSRIDKERKRAEELFGERFNLHQYTESEIMRKFKEDKFAQNALLNGILIYGYDLALELFIGEKRNLSRLLFLNERIKAALRNYANKDFETAKEVAEKTLEQLIFYLLSEKGVSYASKKDAKESVMKLKEGKIIQKINKSSLKNRVSLIENLLLNILKNKILMEGGHA